MPVFPLAIVVAIGIVLLLRKARFHYERLPKILYVAGANLPEVAVAVCGPATESQLERLRSGLPDDTPVLKQAGQAQAEWLLFVAAGTHYARVFLPSLLHYAAEEELDIVTVLLRQEAGTIGEAMLLPFGQALSFVGVNSSRVNARPPSGQVPDVQCRLMRRAAFLAGGKSVRSRVVRAEHMGFSSQEGSIAAVLRRWDGRAFPVLRKDVFGFVQVALAAILLAAWLPMLVILLRNGDFRQAAIFALLPSVVLLPWYRSAWALLAPAAIYVFLWGFMRSMRGQRAGGEAGPLD